MVKRILDLSASDITRMGKKEKLLSIKAAEGRTLISEIICVCPPMLTDVSNIELAAGFGADIILLNVYDVNHPTILGLQNETGDNVIKNIKHLTGRMVGINLEPVDHKIELIDEKVKIAEGRIASIENVKKAISQGIDFIVLTGNPKTGVTNEQIESTIKNIRDEVGEQIIIIAGKMHSSGNAKEIGKGIINKEIAKQFIDAGADIILLPAPGTVPGMTLEYVKEIVDYCHQNNVMTMTTIGTSQEGSDEATIRNIALYSKMAGTDMHHIGDCGTVMGVASPENIMTYSIVIKGKRHTYRRMVRSVNR